MTGSAAGTVLGYSERLVDHARVLALDPDQPSIAVAVGVMACELAVERRIHRELAALDLPEWAGERIAGSEGLSPNNAAVRQLYRDLTDEELEDFPAWAALVETINLRNRIVHTPYRAAPEEVLQAVDVAGAFVTWMLLQGAERA